MKLWNFLTWIDFDLWPKTLAGINCYTLQCLQDLTSLWEEVGHQTLVPVVQGQSHISQSNPDVLIPIFQADSQLIVLC